MLSLEVWKLPLYSEELRSKLPSEWRGHLCHILVCLAALFLGFYWLQWPWLAHSLLHCRDLNSTRRKWLKAIQEVSNRASFEHLKWISSVCCMSYTLEKMFCFGGAIWLCSVNIREAEFVGGRLENGEHVSLCTELCLTVLQHILCGFLFSGFGTKHCDLLSQAIGITLNKFE